MVTASHNPPADNGYKVYVGDGAQIVPPTDERDRGARSSAVGAGARHRPRRRLRHVLDESIVDRLRRRDRRADRARPRVSCAIVHTAMHGVGTEVVRNGSSRAAGFAPPRTVPEQAEPDPDFPTVAFPNPEEPGALDLAVGAGPRAAGPTS